MPCRTGTFAYQHTPLGALREKSRLDIHAHSEAILPSLNVPVMAIIHETARKMLADSKIGSKLTD
jgi:hypothetical protein